MKEVHSGQKHKALPVCFRWRFKQVVLALNVAADVGYGKIKSPKLDKKV